MFITEKTIRKTLSQQDGRNRTLKKLSSDLYTTVAHTYPHLHSLFTHKILKTLKEKFNLTVKNPIKLELGSSKYINKKYTYNEFKINITSNFHQGL